MAVVTIKSDGIVQRHPWNDKYKVMLDDISERDYPNKHYFNKDIMCLDVDKYEAANSDNHEKTVDAVMGICDFDTTKRHSSRERFRMLELRMGYRNPSNIKKSDLAAKISHTKLLLQGSAIDDFTAFIFDASVTAKMKQWFYRWGREYREASHWEAMSPAEFCESVKTADDYPYTPSHDMEQLRSSIASANSCQKLCEIIDYWKDVICQERLHNNLDEIEAIKYALADAIEALDIDSLEDADENAGLLGLYIQDIIRNKH